MDYKDYPNSGKLLFLFIIIFIGVLLLMTLCNKDSGCLL